MLLRSPIIRVLLLGAALMASGCEMLAPAESEPMAVGQAAPVSLDRNSYRLAAGDKIKVEVFGEPDLSIEALIESTGTINYPLLGRVVVQGYTVNDVEQLLARRLSQGYLVNPSVRAGIIQFRPFYVTGQVRHVGAYPYLEGLTVEKALALAGGMTEIASVRKIYILREGFKAVRERAMLSTLVLPGDTIVVDESLF